MQLQKVIFSFLIIMLYHIYCWHILKKHQSFKIFDSYQNSVTDMIFLNICSDISKLILKWCQSSRINFIPFIKVADHKCMYNLPILAKLANITQKQTTKGVATGLKSNLKMWIPPLWWSPSVLVLLLVTWPVPVPFDVTAAAVRVTVLIHSKTSMDACQKRVIVFADWSGSGNYCGVKNVFLDYQFSSFHLHFYTRAEKVSFMSTWIEK